MENCFPPAKSATITVLDNDRLSYSEYSLSSLSMRSLLVSASSARRAEVFTPSPLLWVFSMMEQARSTKAGTVSCFSCLGISTSVQYCVSSLITSCKGKTVGSSGYYRKKKMEGKKQRVCASWSAIVQRILLSACLRTSHWPIHQTRFKEFYVFHLRFKKRNIINLYLYL